MADRLLIINAQVPTFQGLQQIFIDDGVIRGISTMAAIPENIPTIDVCGDWISLGGIDLQINGALGLAFPDLNSENADQLGAICDFLWNQGIDGFCPTIVTTSIENIQRSLSVIAPHSSLLTPHSSQILGVHLEGPFLNPQKRGAHPEQYLLPLTVDKVKRVLGDYASIVKIMTIAPELDPTGTAIAYLKSLGIRVSLGHSQATAAQAQTAFEQGASMVTHAFNAMPSLHHREPGLLGAAIMHPSVQCGLIADGQHVAPLMLDLLLRASDYDRGLFLVSDALSPLGLPDGIYPWDARQIEVKHGTARLPDGTLAGTTLPLFVGVENLVKWGICRIDQAIALATTAPRHAMSTKGASSEGPVQPDAYLNQPARLIRWHQNPLSQTLTWQRFTIAVNARAPVS